MILREKILFNILLVLLIIFIETGLSAAYGGGGSEGGDQPPIVQPIAATTNFSYACQHLGIDPIDASKALRSEKESIGWRGDCTFDLSNGNAIVNGESIGNLGG